jgi:hypothetical protein
MPTRRDFSTTCWAGWPTANEESTSGGRKWGVRIRGHASGYENLLKVVIKRRGVRRFEKGKKVDRETLLQIAEASRWAPTGANAQCWDLIVVEDADTRQAVLDVFLRQSQR